MNTKPIILTDKDFLEGIKTNDDRILNVLYKTHFSMVLNFVVNNSGTEEEAKDVYQEAIIVLIRQVQSEKGFDLSCQLKTYIYSICRRMWLKELSKKQRFSDTSVEDYEGFLIVEESRMQEIEHKEHQFEVMSQGLETLGEPCKTILLDFYTKKLSMEEIAQKMGYTNADNAKNQKYKCLKRLSKNFFSHYKSNNDE